MFDGFGWSKNGWDGYGNDFPILHDAWMWVNKKLEIAQLSNTYLETRVKQ